MTTIDIYTDGGCKPVPIGNGGWGFYGRAADNSFEVKGCGAAGKDTTNNRAELHAVINALSYLKSNSSKFTSARLLLDSEITVNILLRFREYRDRDFCKKNKEPLKNNDLWKKVATELDAVTIPLTYGWVRGHSDIPGNVIADKLASEGVERQAVGNEESRVEETPLTAGEESPDTTVDIDTEVDVDDLKTAKYDFHPMISGNNWYFRLGAATVDNTGRWIYSITRYSSQSKQGMTKREKDDIRHKAGGRRSSNNHFALVLTTAPIDVLEQIRGKMEAHAEGIAHPCVGLVGEIKKGKAIGKLLTDVDAHTELEDQHLRLKDGTVICTYVTPPLLIFRLEDRFLFLLKAVEDYLVRSENFNYTDVTDSFIEVDSKGNHAISKKFPNGDNLRSLPDIDVGGGRKATALAICDTDIPHRNVFSAMIKKDKKRKMTITVLTFDCDEVSYRFLTIVHWGDEIAAYYTDDANYRMISPSIAKVLKSKKKSK